MLFRTLNDGQKRSIETPEIDPFPSTCNFFLAMLLLNKNSSCDFPSTNIFVAQLAIMRSINFRKYLNNPSFVAHTCPVKVCVLILTNVNFPATIPINPAFGDTEWIASNLYFLKKNIILSRHIESLNKLIFLIILK